MQVHDSLLLIRLWNCGALELQRGNEPAARRHYERALGMARNDTERRYLEKRLRASTEGLVQ